MSEDFGYHGAEQPAFPMQTRQGHETFLRPVFGLTKREYFAACAMQGISTRVCTDASDDEPNVAKKCVALADALIDALSKAK